MRVNEREKGEEEEEKVNGTRYEKVGCDSSLWPLCPQCTRPALVNGCSWTRVCARTANASL